MKSSLRASFAMLVTGSLFAFAGCSDDDAGDTGVGGADGAGGAGAQNIGGAFTAGIECKVVGELCHEADAASGAAHDCHELGHQGNAAACEKAFDGCIATCVDDDGAGGAPTAPQDSRCAAIGELCHEVDDGNGPLHECHEVGHVGNAAKCAQAFGDCATRCLAAREELEAGGGAGGHAGGGEPSSSGGAAGASLTAAGTAGSAG